MRLRARSPEWLGQEIRARVLRGGNPSYGYPVIRVEGGLVLGLDTAFETDEVFEATPEEQRLLQQWGHPVGGLE